MSSETPKFTRRDFQFIADTLQELRPLADSRDSAGMVQQQNLNYQYYAQVRSWARRLRETNPSFNGRKFCEAAGLPLTECLDY